MSGDDFDLVDEPEAELQPAIGPMKYARALIFGRCNKKPEAVDLLCRPPPRGKNRRPR